MSDFMHVCERKRESDKKNCERREQWEKEDFSHIHSLIRAHHPVIQQNCEFVCSCYSGLPPHTHTKVAPYFHPKAETENISF